VQVVGCRGFGVKITINAIPVEGMDLSQDMQASDLGLETDSVHYPDKVHVACHVQKSKDVMTVDCAISATNLRECGKCLCEFEADIEKKDQFIYTLTGEHVINISDDIKDSIIIDYPIKMVCKEDCKGLCANCGKNLNHGQCDCD